MKNKLRICLGIILVSFSLSSCGAFGGMPNADEEQMDAISEYAAVLLLKYDANNRSRLVDDETIRLHDERVAKLEALRQPKPEPEEETSAADDGAQAQEQPEVLYPQQEEANDTFEDFYDFPQGVKLAYAGYSVCDVFPENDSSEEAFTIEATPGKKLIALKFLLANTGSENQTIDIFGYNASYKITLNGSTTRGILTTMLLGDLSTYRDTISANSSREVVLLTEMDQETLSDIQSITLQIRNSAKTVKIGLE